MNKYVSLLLTAIFYLRTEHRLRIFEDRMIRRASGPKRDQIMGGWKKLHNEALYDSYSSHSSYSSELTD
jgi:hypothetical protein